MKVFEGISYGREHIADYACFAENSRGRLFQEPDSPTRTPFQRDRDRIIHSTAFRRMKHKTQVFVHHVGDHYRTRLTHSLEVSQIARSLARALRVDEDLAECLALCHDFGHTPFGHVGEEALDSLVKEWGGFDHNAQSLRVVTELEQQYAEFDGLNLCWETLEGLVKHNGPLVGSDIPQAILSFNSRFDLELASHASIEAQCAAIADDIAYNAHDLDDGLRAQLFGFEDLREVSLIAELLDEVEDLYPALEDRRKRHEIVRRQITIMVEDAISTAMNNLQRVKPSNATEVRNCGETIVEFSDEMKAKEVEVKAFLFDRMYRSPQVLVMRDAAIKIIKGLFDIYSSEPDSVPPNLYRHLEGRNEGSRMRRIADFIASMTDDYALKEYERLFDDAPQLG